MQFDIFYNFLNNTIYVVVFLFSRYLTIISTSWLCSEFLLVNEWNENTSSGSKNFTYSNWNISISSAYLPHFARILIWWTKPNLTADSILHGSMWHKQLSVTSCSVAWYTHLSMIYGGGESWKVTTMQSQTDKQIHIIDSSCFIVWTKDQRKKKEDKYVALQRYVNAI